MKQTKIIYLFLFETISDWEIFKELNLYKAEVLDAWYKLFKTSSPEAFAELIKTLETA